MTVFRLLAQLGLEVNLPKSRIPPAQVFDFLGATFNTLSLTISPTVQRVSALTTTVTELYDSPSFTARVLSACIGKLDSVADLVPFGRWTVRPFHWTRIDHWSPVVNSYDDLPSTIPPDHSFVIWWTIVVNLLSGMLIHVPLPDFLMFADASETAWGARLTS